MEEVLCALTSATKAGFEATTENFKTLTNRIARLASKTRFKFKLCGLGFIGFGLAAVIAGKEALALEDDISELRKEIKRLKESDREE